MNRAALTVGLLSVISATQAQERNFDLDNSVRLDYQYIRTSAFNASAGPVDVGKTDTHVFLLSGAYSLNDRWKIFASIPYVQKRQNGAAGVHDPVVDFFEFTPPDLRNVDDGNYHGGFQDLHVGVQALAIDGPLSVSPFVSYGFPVSNYPFYAAAAIGRHLRELHVGISLEFKPHFSDWYFQADVAHAFSESVLGVDLDYWNMYFSASYYLTARFAPRVFMTRRHAPNALRFPDDFPDYDTENGYRHDQTIQHNYLNAGLSFDYVISNQYEVSATYYRTIDPQQVTEVDHAFTMGLTRRF